MKRKEIATLLLTTITAITLTACSYQFNVSDGYLPTIAPNEIEQQIDATDFTSEEEIEELAQEISDWGNEQLDVEFVKASLVRVVDGDTIVVDINANEYSVRLIGINTPESVHPEEDRNCAEGITASEYTKDLLKDVEVLYLQTDISDTDKYDRLLRYVWLEIPNDCNDLEEIRTKMLNGILVEHGVAEVATYPPDVLHKEDFEELEH